MNQHLFYVKKSSTQQIKIIPASRAVTTAGARRFAPSKSILIRLEEFRRYVDIISDHAYPMDAGVVEELSARCMTYICATSPPGL